MELKSPRPTLPTRDPQWFWAQVSIDFMSPLQPNNELKAYCAHCRHDAGGLHSICICIISMSIWMSILNFSISQKPWHMLKFFQHPVHAAGTLQAHCSKIHQLLQFFLSGFTFFGYARTKEKPVSESSFRVR